MLCYFFQPKKKAKRDCGMEYKDFTCTFQLKFENEFSFDFHSMKSHFNIWVKPQNTTSFHQGNIARIGLAVNCQNCLAIWKTRTGTLMPAENGDEASTLNP